MLTRLEVLPYELWMAGHGKISTPMYHRVVTLSTEQTAGPIDVPNFIARMQIMGQTEDQIEWAIAKQTHASVSQLAIDYLRDGELRAN